jgi:HPt (histidine-containing phosphotransfer) domain-containing protein
MTTTAWPEIEGIDTQDARSRWCDDLPLFRSMLEKCLAEYSEIVVPSSPILAAERHFQAARLHKLRGGACMLGAKVIEHLAAQAEAALMAGDVTRARERSIALATHLEALRSSAAHSFERAATAIA